MKKLILLALTVFALTAQAGNDVGGGGMICITPKKCMTLAEAGLRIKEDPASVMAPAKPAVAKEVIEEMSNVIHDIIYLPSNLRSNLLEFTTVSPTTYINVDFYDSKKFSKVQKKYNKILKENNFPSDNFMIAAISDKNSTYILPEFYKLNKHSQALVLIHEGVVRKSGSFKLALQIDGAILDSLSGKRNLYKLITLLNKVFSFDNQEADTAVFVYEQYFIAKKKYELSREFAQKMLQPQGVNLKTDLYLANELYTQYPELWNAMNIANITNICGQGNDQKLRTIYEKDGRYYKYNQLVEEPFEDYLNYVGLVNWIDKDYCNQLPDGDYLIGVFEEQKLSLIYCRNQKIEVATPLDTNNGKWPCN